MCEHLEISAFTWKRVQGDDDSVVKRLQSLAWFWRFLNSLPTATILKLLDG